MATQTKQKLANLFHGFRFSHKNNKRKFHHVYLDVTTQFEAKFSFSLAFVSLMILQSHKTPTGNNNFFVGIAFIRATLCCLLRIESLIYHPILVEKPISIIKRKRLQKVDISSWTLRFHNYCLSVYDKKGFIKQDSKEYMVPFSIGSCIVFLFANKQSLKFFFSRSSSRLRISWVSQHLAAIQPYRPPLHESFPCSLYASVLSQSEGHLAVDWMIIESTYESNHDMLKDPHLHIITFQISGLLLTSFFN